MCVRVQDGICRLFLWSCAAVLELGFGRGCAIGETPTFQQELALVTHPLTGHTKSVIHVSGINGNPCVRNGQNFFGALGGIRTPGPQIRSQV
jgi:hypothetical protein